MEFEKLIERIKEVIEKYCYFEKNEYGYSQEIYCDYNDEMSDDTIKEILESKNPMDAFQDQLYEWAIDYEIEYGLSETEKKIKSYLTEEELQCWEENEDKMNEWVNEHILFYYPESHFNKEVRVNIMLDTGDGNYDFTMNNVLNWDGQHSEGEFEKESSMLWLAKQQGKATALRKACKRVFRGDCYYVDREKEKDKFIESMIQELENLSSHMSTLTFLVSMDLFDLFKLKEVIEKEPCTNKYHPQENKGNGYIVISKDTICGLFNPWDGGGSVLEIELNKDVKLPIKYIWKADLECHGREWSYGIDNVYGLSYSCWHGKIKEIKENTIKED